MWPCKHATRNCFYQTDLLILSIALYFMLAAAFPAAAATTATICCCRCHLFLLALESQTAVLPLNKHGNAKRLMRAVTFLEVDLRRAPRLGVLRHLLWSDSPCTAADPTLLQVAAPQGLVLLQQAYLQLPAGKAPPPAVQCYAW